MPAAPCRGGGGWPRLRIKRREIYSVGLEKETDLIQMVLVVFVGTLTSECCSAAATERGAIGGCRGRRSWVLAPGQEPHDLRMHCGRSQACTR